MTLAPLPTGIPCVNSQMKRASRSSGVAVASVFLVLCVAAHAEVPQAPGTPSVLEHHANPTRSGLYVAPGLTLEAAAQLHADPQFHADLSGPVYAQPLYWAAPGADRGLLLVATEQNLVYALDSRTGALAWRTPLGPPVPRSALPCGNIDPLGVTGTPVIDAHSQALYLDAMIRDQVSGEPRHWIFALSLKDGSVLPGWPVDVEAALKAAGHKFVSAIQNQRSALTVIGDTVYVPFGGHFGDCGDYRGWIVSVSLHAPQVVHSWSTRAPGGGVWAPGGISADTTGLYFSTGNTLDAGRWSDGEAVIRLAPDLSFSAQPRDYFAPADWSRLDAADFDLGGTNPLSMHFTGGTMQHLILALGKDGNAYVLDPHNLGGIGGSLLTRKVSSVPIRTSPAYLSAGDEAFVAFQGKGIDCPRGTEGDLVGLRLLSGSPPQLAVLWCAAANGRGSPIITTTDGRANAIVWIVGAEDSNRLRGFRADSGAVVFAGGGAAEAMHEVRRFQTPIVAGRHIFIAADQRLYAFLF